VRLLYNGTQDEAGRSTALLAGYRVGDPLTEVWRGDVEVETEALASTDEVEETACEILFEMFNRDDRLFGNCFRSLSIGDVVEFHATRHRWSAARIGWKRLGRVTDDADTPLEVTYNVGIVSPGGRVLQHTAREQFGGVFMSQAGEAYLDAFTITGNRERTEKLAEVTVRRTGDQLIEIKRFELREVKFDAVSTGEV